MIFHIVGEDTKIEIEVFTQSYPQSTDYWGGNWLNAFINCEIPGFNAKFGLHLRTDELKDFADQLKAMSQQSTGKAALYNLDGFIELEGALDDSGRIEWVIALCYPAGNGATLKFDFHSNRNDLQQSIIELDEILTAFPVIGTP